MELLWLLSPASFSLRPVNRLTYMGEVGVVDLVAWWTFLCEGVGEEERERDKYWVD